MSRTAESKGKCGCGGHLGLQGWRRAVWMGCMGAWLAYAAHAGVPHAVLGTRGGGRPWAVGTTYLPGSGGRALDDGLSKPLPWWPQQSRPIHAERADPPKSASTGSNFISTKSETCANDDTTVMRGVGQCSKTVVSHALSSHMVLLCASQSRTPVPDTHQKFAATLHAPGDTRDHGRWITITGARQRNRLRTMRQGRAVQAPSRSRTHGAKGRTSQM